MKKPMALLTVGLLLMVAAPMADAAPPEPQCMQVYQEYDFGAVRIVSPNSCEAHVWVLGHQVI